MSEEQEQVEGEQQEQQEEVIPKNILKPDQIAAGLSQVSRTHGTLLSLIRYLDGSSYAFVNLNIDEKELEELGDQLRLNQHLRYLSAAKNSFKDITEVTYLPYLLTLNFSENQIEDIRCLSNSREYLPFLQVSSFRS